jgi:MOSC domain-containing protein YiiM
MSEITPLSAAGRIVRLQLKPREGRSRGIPKRPVDELVITADGVKGDFNRWRTEKAAGDPDQAVLLLAEEVLAELRTEGWPVGPGDLGENLLLAGLPGDALTPGARVRAGSVELEISKRCDPCVVLYGLPYVGQERGPAFVRTMRGRRGWFARVIRGGVLRAGIEVGVVAPVAQARGSAPGTPGAEAAGRASSDQRSKVNSVSDTPSPSKS